MSAVPSTAHRHDQPANHAAPKARAVELSGWGRHPRSECALLEARGAEDVLGAIAGNQTLIARGNGRSYGDPALNPAGTLSLLKSNRFIDFDPASGMLTCEAGVLLEDVIDTFLPRGWFPPVTPGTKFVTIGGMIASNVHGKNHHLAGSFGNHVESLDLALADGQVMRCSRTENESLFEATCGGMGLTGVILRARFRLMPVETSFIRRETRRLRNLSEAMDAFEAARDWTYSVAWIDCLARGDALGRSLLFLGEHARADELPGPRRLSPLALPKKHSRTVPIDVPGFVQNRWSIGAFNELYYRIAPPGTDVLDYDRFFYPLDGILEWRRLYGRAGLVQYQCVLPLAASRAGLTLLLKRIADAGLGSFLGVLKLFGQQKSGLMSFPMEGYTLALDFPASAKTLALFPVLDAIVADHGGRLYLAKDAATSPAMIERFYPGLAQFRAVRKRVDPAGKFTSLQSRRLGL
ncbi:MAG TPA: FAD-binding oxidoreductase [Stellaceae bacterium]|nr:FAD-binding oxidoreductase [Stellaceae bacterium]